MDDEDQYSNLFPISLNVEAGGKYLWCGCDKSKTPPLCDKTDCGDKSVLYCAELTVEVYFCNCKCTKKPPFCDGSHAKLLLDAIKNRRPK